MRSEIQFLGEVAPERAPRRVIGAQRAGRSGLLDLGRGRQHRFVAERGRRIINVLTPLVLAVFLVFPAIPVRGEGGLRKAHRFVVDTLHRVSLQQKWGMYAPNPARAHIATYATAVYPDGTEVELEESIRSDAEDGHIWLWNRSRVDFWRYQVVAQNPDRPNRNRSWYLRGLCVREARKGETPRLIRLYSARAKLRPPKSVRKGRSVLTKPERKLIETTACRMGRIRRMIDEDPHGRAQAE